MSHSDIDFWEEIEALRESSEIECKKHLDPFQNPFGRRIAHLLIVMVEWFIWV